jgi:hypothetical protein
MATPVRNTQDNQTSLVFPANAMKAYEIKI